MGLLIPIEVVQAQRIAELEAENAQLRAENERLRELRHETPAYMKADELQLAALDRAISWFNDRDLPYRQSAMILAAIESFIGGAIVTHTRGIKAALADVPAKYLGAFAEFDRRRREAGYTDPISDAARAHTHDLYEGVQRLVTGQDNGEALNALLTAEGSPVIREMLQLPKVSKGRGAGNIDRTTEVIGQAAINHKNQPGHENKTWGQVYIGIIAILESARNPDSQRAAKSLRDIETKRRETGRGKTPGDKIRECVLQVQKRGW